MHDNFSESIWNTKCTQNVLIVLLHYHLLQVSDICNIYIYVTFCVTNTRDFRALSTNNIITANWKVGESSQNTKLLVCFISQYIIFTFPLILLWIRQLENRCNYFHYNCQSNHDSLIGVLSPHNSNRGDKVINHSCVSKWGVRPSIALWLVDMIQPTSPITCVVLFKQISPLLFWLYFSIFEF